MRAVESVPVGDLMASQTGSLNPAKFSDEQFDLYSIPAFDSGEPVVLRGAEIGSSKQVVQPQDVLLSKIVPHIRRSWIVGNSNGRRLIASGEWIVFRNPRIDPKYLRHVVVGDPFHAQFMQTVSGVGGSLLRARPAHVAKIEIPLPPLSEQRRIAAILDQAETLRSQRRVAIAQLDSLGQAVFLEMFGESLTSTKRTPLRNLVTEFRYGTSEKSGSTGYPALRIPNVASGSLDPSELKTVAVTSPEFERLRLIDGDLLFVRTNGNPDYVGRCAVFEGSAVAQTAFDPSEFIYASYLIRARMQTDVILPMVLQKYLTEGEGRRDLRTRCKTSAGQYNINTEALGALPIPEFPMAAQQTFADRTQSIGQLKVTHRAALAQLNELFASVQHRAFRGEL